MSTMTVRRAPVKPTRKSQRPAAPFAAGLYTQLPPEPEAPAMPRRVRWHPIDLAPLSGLVEPEPELAASGAWRMPGEDSWDFGHPA